MKRHIDGIIVTIKPSDFDKYALTLILTAYANDIAIEKRGVFREDKNFQDSFSLLFDHAKATILEQIKKLDAINWDKDKMQQMMKEKE